LKHLSFVALILFLAAAQATLPRLVALGALQPLLLVPVVLAFALRLQTVEGAALAFAAGFALDATGGWPTGLASFACVALFVGSRIALAGLRADGRLFEAAFAFAMTAAYHLVTLGLTRLFGPPMPPLEELPWLETLLWSSLATAVVSPPLLAVARRIERFGPRPAGII
jgi:rod shape-determining protein MreD